MVLLRCGGMSIGDAAFLLVFLGLHAQYFGMYVKRDWDGIDKSEYPQLFDYSKSSKSMTTDQGN